MVTMADKIVAALEYLDAHTTLVLQKHKHRSLGDIDAKYEVIDPTELPLSKAMHDSVSLAGTKRTNLSKQKTVDQIVDEDRKRLVQSAQGTRSPSAKSGWSSRPLTSSSRISRDRKSRTIRPDSQMTSSSLTSIKHVPFTPPGVTVGPTDARDEVMKEIVSKPLTHTQSKIRNSDHEVRQVSSAQLPRKGGNVSVGSRPFTSLKRSKTFHGRSNRLDNRKMEWDGKSGPFTTVKVSEADMWVVAKSTPSAYFDVDLANGVTVGSTEGSKLPRWDETADSVPREEKKSVPRFERKLGAPPQFGPTSQWYTFSGVDPSKKHPILTSFADDQTQEYYNIESEISATVADQLQASPGIRIGRNGVVIADSMKLSKKDNPSDQTDEEGYQSADPNEHSDDGAPQTSDDEKLTADGRNSDASSSRDNKSPVEADGTVTSEPEDKKFTLLRFVGVANGENPYVSESTSSSTSSSSVTAVLASMAEKTKPSLPNGGVSQTDEAVWKLLKEASPSFWISKDQWRKMREKLIQKKAKREMTVEHEALSPLSWKEQLQQTDAKVLEVKSKQRNGSAKEVSDSFPVVFHKLLSYEQLPIGFVHLTGNGYRPHSVVARVDKDFDMSPPSKGYESTIAPPRRSAKTRVASSGSVSFASSPPPRPVTSPTQRNAASSGSALAAGLDLSEILRVGEGSLPNRTAAENDSCHNIIVKDDVSEEELLAVRREAANNMKMTGSMCPVISEERNDLIKRSLQFKADDMQESKAQSPRSGSGRAVTLNSLQMKTGATISTVDIRPSLPKSSMPVSSLNLSELDEDYNVINGPNPPSPASQNRGEEISYVPHRASGGTVLKAPKPSPASAVPSQRETQAVSESECTPTSNDSTAHEKAFSVHSRAGRSTSTSRRPTASSRNSMVHLHTGEFPRHPGVNKGFHSSPLTGRSSGGKPVNRYNSTSSKSSRGAIHGHHIIESAEALGDGAHAKPGYIQISRSLNVPTQRPSSAKIGRGNKVYDSYMRELSSRNELRGVNPLTLSETTRSVVVKSLGGNSGKSAPDQFISSKENRSAPGVPSFRAKSSPQSIGMRNANRRTADYHAAADYPIRAGHPSRSSGGRFTSFGLQGDPVRLNLDKNINVIYRDLGILSKSGHNLASPQSKILTYQEAQTAGVGDKQSLRSSSRRSDGRRSKVHSAKSGGSLEEAGSLHSTVVTIPTANGSNELHDEAPKQSFGRSNTGNVKATDANAQSSGSIRAKSASHAQRQRNEQDGTDGSNSRISAPSRPYSSKSREMDERENEVVDFGTQYNTAELQEFESDFKPAELKDEETSSSANACETPVEKRSSDGIPGNDREPAAVHELEKYRDNCRSQEADQSQNGQPEVLKNHLQVDRAECPQEHVASDHVKISNAINLEQNKSNETGESFIPQNATSVTAASPGENEMTLSKPPSAGTNMLQDTSSDDHTKQAELKSSEIADDSRLEENASMFFLQKSEEHGAEENPALPLSRRRESRNMSAMSELGNDERTNTDDVSDDDKDADENVSNVLGVTKVTVNIQPIAKS